MQRHKKLKSLSSYILQKLELYYELYVQIFYLSFVFESK